MCTRALDSLWTVSSPLRQKLISCFNVKSSTYQLDGFYLSILMKNNEYIHVKQIYIILDEGWCRFCLHQSVYDSAKLILYLYILVCWELIFTLSPSFLEFFHSHLILEFWFVSLFGGLHLKMLRAYFCSVLRNYSWWVHRSIWGAMDQGKWPTLCIISSLSTDIWKLQNVLGKM